MNETIKRMAVYNKIGIVMNAVSAVLMIQMFALVLAIAVTIRILGGNPAPALIGSLMDIAEVVILAMIAPCAVLCIVPLVAGWIWDKRYVKEKRPGFGRKNQIVQLIFNGICVLGIILALMNEGDFFVLLLGIYELVICFCHLKCILLSGEALSSM